jgi:hypothetical protein
MPDIDDVCVDLKRGYLEKGFVTSTGGNRRLGVLFGDTFCQISATSSEKE